MRFGSVLFLAAISFVLLLNKKYIYKMIKWALVSPKANDINGQTAPISKSHNIFYLVIT